MKKKNNDLEIKRLEDFLAKVDKNIDTWLKKVDTDPSDIDSWFVVRNYITKRLTDINTVNSSYINRLSFWKDYN